MLGPNLQACVWTLAWVQARMWVWMGRVRARTGARVRAATPWFMAVSRLPRGEMVRGPLKLEEAKEQPHAMITLLAVCIPCAMQELMRCLGVVASWSPLNKMKLLTATSWLTNLLKANEVGCLTVPLKAMQAEETVVVALVVCAAITIAWTVTSRAGSVLGGWWTRREILACWEASWRA